MGALDKLQELRSRPGFGNIDIKSENPQKQEAFKSNKIQLRDKTNPYEQYR